MRHRLAKSLALALLTTLNWASAQSPDGSILALGSGSMEMAMLAWRDGYKAQVPEFRMEIRPDGSGAAPKALLSGEAQIGLMSREMKAEEVAAFQTKMGYPPTRVAVAIDALVILVNKNNPIQDIHIDQLDAIYSSTRRQGLTKDITTWGDLGLSQSGWANRPIVRWDRPEASGTRSFFHDTVLKGDKGKPDTLVTQEESGIAEELFLNQVALGYGSLSEVFSAIKAVPVYPLGGKTAVPATLDNVTSGAYPLARFLFVYLNKAPGKPLPASVTGFLRYTLSPEGQKLLKSVGQVPLPEEMVKIGLRRLN